MQYAVTVDPLIYIQLAHNISSVDPMNQIIMQLLMAAVI